MNGIGNFFGTLVALQFLVLTIGCSSPDEKRYTPEERAELEHAAKFKKDFECEQAEIETRIMNLNGFVNLYTALKFGLVAPVNAEIDRQGTANIMLETPYERTALYEACRYGADQMVELLLSRGADPSIRSGGELPINTAWVGFISDPENSLCPSFTKEEIAEEPGRYERILEMLSVPSTEFEPRSEEANVAVALEMASRFLIYEKDDFWKDEVRFNFNDSDCPASLIEGFRERGFPIHPESQTAKREVVFGIEWIADDRAEAFFLIPRQCDWQAIVVYAYGHWLVESYTLGSIY